MKNVLDNAELSQVTGGSGIKSESEVHFRYSVGARIDIRRSSDLKIISALITDRGINKFSDGTFYTCYYVDVSPYLGDGWLGDIDGVKFENRIGGTPYKTGM